MVEAVVRAEAAVVVADAAGGGSPFGGGGGGFGGGGSDTSRRYSLTLSVNARNVFNNVNLATPAAEVESAAGGGRRCVVLDAILRCIEWSRGRTV